MSTEHEGEVPEYGADPTAQFEAFRTRQADDREQQETQAAYTFPPEYAVAPEAFFAPSGPAGPMGPPQGDTGSRRMRSVLVFAGAVLVACVLGLGAWLAFGSSGPSADASSTGTTTTPAATATGGTTSKRALTFRVTIVSVGSDSFTGTVPTNGESVTVTLTSKTRFGTKAHPLTRDALTVGETVIVRGRRIGTNTVTATVVAANVTASADASGTAGAAT